MTKKDESNIKNEDKNEDQLTDSGPGQEEEKFEELVQAVSDFENKYKRAIADYQNLQKRVIDERRDLILAANRDLLLRMLSVLDTLILARKHDESETLKISISHFLDILKSEGVTKIETEGKDFDPALMECVATETGAENKVIEEVRSGYMLNDKVLRPAQVKVGEEEQTKEEN